MLSTMVGMDSSSSATTKPIAGLVLRLLFVARAAHRLKVVERIRAAELHRPAVIYLGRRTDTAVQPQLAGIPIPLQHQRTITNELRRPPRTRPRHATQTPTPKPLQHPGSRGRS